jgi:hypothetical protein
MICDNMWRTRSAKAGGWHGNTNISIQIKTDPGHHGWLNEIEVTGVAGCIDVDFNFSPSTNLIPIQRYNLKVGEKADLTAAWHKLSSFNIEPLPQSYTRLDEHVYRYVSGNRLFVAELRVNPAGFVVDYPGSWLAEGGS